jgi:ribosomal protein S27AE
MNPGRELDAWVAEKVSKRARNHRDYLRRREEILARHRARYRAKREEILLYQKEYLKSDKAKESGYKKARAWAARNPEKRKAHELVKAAIRKGDLKKLLCSQCGNRKSLAHHQDYSRPLDVTWLCRECHRREHAAR